MKARMGMIVKTLRDGISVPKNTTGEVVAVNDSEFVVRYKTSCRRYSHKHLALHFTKIAR